MSRVKFWSLFAGLAAVYVLAGKIGLLFAFVQSNATAIWAPTGIAIAALLLFDRRLWPAVFVGAFVTNITTAGNVFTSLGIALGNTLEAVCAVYLVNRFANGAKAFERANDVLLFSFFAGLVGTAVSPTIGVTSLALGGFASWANYAQVWLTWWLGDMGGALIVAPFLILWITDYRIRWDFRKFLEVLLLILTLGLFGFLVIFAKLGILFIFMSPILVWVAFRFDRRTMAAALFIMTEIFIWEVLISPMPSGGTATLNESLILLQAYMASIFVTMMALAAAVAEDKKSKDRLLAYSSDLFREKARDEAILESIGDGLIVTDGEGKIILMNPEAETMFGWSLEEAMGKFATDVIPIEDEKGKAILPEERPLALALKHGKPMSVLGPTTYYYVRKNKTKFPVAIIANPIIVDGKVVGAVDLIKDITVEKELDREKSEFI